MDIEQIKLSLKVNEETRNNIFDSLKNTNDINLKLNLLSQLKEIDQNIVYYNSLLSKNGKDKYFIIKKLYR